MMSLNGTARSALRLAAVALLGVLLPFVALGQTATTTTLSSALNPSAYGQNVTLTASVSGGTPTGTIVFKDGAAVLGTRTLPDTTASFNSLTFVTNSLVAGTHSLTAVYSGNAASASSTSSNLSQVVNQASHTLVLTAAQGTVTVGQNLNLMANVGSARATGVVTFTDNASALGTATVAGGVASLSTTALTLGTHTVAASYGGDANHTASSAAGVTVSVVVRGTMTWQYGYDALGRINTVVDPNNLASYFSYDGLGRRIQTQQPANIGAGTPTVTGFTYDLGDNLTGVTDPRGLVTSYTPSGLGDVTTQTSPDTGTSRYTYDGRGNLLTATDARGKVTTYTYDALNRLTSMSYPSGTATAFEYDGGASPTPAAAGELTKITDESGQTTYSYDAVGRMTGKTVAIGSKTFTVGYGWGDSGSALDKLTSITYPSGSRVNYGYSARGVIQTVSVSPVNASGTGVGSAQALLSSVTYTVDGQISGWVWSDSQSRPIGYDSFGQIASYTLGDPNGTGTMAGSLRTVSHDAAGRITAYSHTNNGSPTVSLDQSFGYDDLNRLTTVTQATGSTGYSYDASGNRTVKTIGGTAYTQTISLTSNRLAVTSDALGSASVTHDVSGNVTDDGSATYSYSDRGRLAGASTPGGSVTYAYNGLGLRAKKSGSAVSTGAAQYIYDEAGLLLGEYDQTGNPIYETLYLNTTPVGAINQTGTAGSSSIAVTLYNVYADHLDAPRLITKQDQTIVWRWDTAEAFGATGPDQNPSGVGTFTFNLRFPGQVFDSETGLNQNWNREYNPRWGRYSQGDPIGLEGGINPFLYGDENPLSYIDPDGLDAGAMSLPNALPSFTAACLANAALCGPTLAGMGGFAAGTLLYPYIAESLGDAIDQCVAMAEEHTKNPRPSNWNKHTKPRPGRDSEKKRQDPNWKPNPNKRK